MKRVSFDELTRKISFKDNMARSVRYKKQYFIIKDARVLAYNYSQDSEAYWEIRKHTDHLNRDRFRFTAAYYKKSHIELDNLD